MTPQLQIEIPGLIYPPSYSQYTLHLQDKIIIIIIIITPASHPRATPGPPSYPPSVNIPSSSYRQYTCNNMLYQLYKQYVITGLGWNNIHLFPENV